MPQDRQDQCLRGSGGMIPELHSNVRSHRYERAGLSTLSGYPLITRPSPHLHSGLPKATLRCNGASGIMVCKPLHGFRLSTLAAFKGSLPHRKWSLHAPSARCRRVSPRMRTPPTRSPNYSRKPGYAGRRPPPHRAVRPWCACGCSRSAAGPAPGAGWPWAAVAGCRPPS